MRSASTFIRYPRSFAMPVTSATPRRSATHPCRSPAHVSINRPRCLPNHVSSPAKRSAPTAPAHSCWRPLATHRRAPPTALWVAWLGSCPTTPRGASMVRCSPLAPRSRGCTRLASSAGPKISMRWAALLLALRASRLCLASPDLALRFGHPTPKARSPVYRSALHVRM